MNCKQIQKKLSVWLSGELSGESAKVIESHLAACPECMAELRFQQRLTEQVGGSAMPAPTMRYRLETELDEVDAGWNAAYEKWASFGANLMKKAVWPVTAALVAVGTYTIMFPQGALAVAWKDSMSAAQDGADEARKTKDQESSEEHKVVIRMSTESNGDLSTSLMMSTSATGAVEIIEAEDLSEAETALMSALKISNNVDVKGNTTTYDWSVDFDKSRYEFVNGGSAGTKTIVPKGNSNLRAVVRFDADTNELKKVVFERRIDGKWQVYGTSYQSMKSIASDDLKSITDPVKLKEIEEKLRSLKDEDFVFEFDPADFERLSKDLKGEFLGFDGVDVYRLKIEEGMSPEERAKFRVEMDKLREEMKDLKLTAPQRMTEAERKEFEKAMKDMRFQLKDLDIDLDISEEALKLKLEGLEELKLDRLSDEKLRLHEVRLNRLEDVTVSLKVESKDGKTVEKWDVSYDKDRYAESAGPADNVTYLTEKKDTNKRVVITRERKDGKVIRIEKQSKKDGKWVTEKSTLMDDVRVGRRRVEPPAQPLS